MAEIEEWIKKHIYLVSVFLVSAISILARIFFVKVADEFFTKLFGVESLNEMIIANLFPLILCVIGYALSYYLGRRQSREEINALKVELATKEKSFQEQIDKLKEEIHILKNPSILEKCLKLNDPTTNKDRYFGWNGRGDLHLISVEQGSQKLGEFEKILRDALIKENLNPIKVNATYNKNHGGNLVYEISNDGMAKWSILTNYPDNTSTYFTLGVEPLKQGHY